MKKFIPGCKDMRKAFIRVFSKSCTAMECAVGCGHRGCWNLGRLRTLLGWAGRRSRRMIRWVRVAAGGCAGIVPERVVRWSVVLGVSAGLGQGRGVLEGRGDGRERGRRGDIMGGRWRVWRGAGHGCWRSGWAGRGCCSGPAGGHVVSRL